MTQEAIVISTTPPLPGLKLVQDTNAALQTIATDFAGPSDPASLAGPYMTWADTANGLIKRRNAAGSDWVIEGHLFRPDLPVVPVTDIPGSDIGPIVVATQGLMEWDGARYTVSEATHGQCRFVFVSSTECRLMPYDGNGLVINGRQYRIGAAGVPITTAATAANGRYFVFAKDDGSGGIALELASTTGASYSIHTDGVTIKTGDPTRTLVGWVATTAGNTFADSAVGNRYVASWFNRRRRSTSEQISGATSSTTTVGLGSGRSLFNWAGEEVEAKLSSYGVLSTSAYYTMEARRGGVAPAYVPGVAAGRNGGGPASISNITADTPSEDVAVYQVFGSVSAGSVSLVIRLTCTTNI